MGIEVRYKNEGGNMNESIARDRRYRAPICKDINIAQIKSTLEHILDATSELDWATHDEFLELLDDDETAEEFRSSFAILNSDADRLLTDLDDEWIPELFDLFFVTANPQNSEILGWDAFENDYMGLGGAFDVESAGEVAKKALTRLTKEKLLETAAQCSRILLAYLSVKTRFDDLNASFSILQGEHATLMKALSDVNTMYDKAEAVGFRDWSPTEKEFQAQLDALPLEIWV